MAVYLHRQPLTNYQVAVGRCGPGAALLNQLRCGHHVSHRYGGGRGPLTCGEEKGSVRRGDGGGVRGEVSIRREEEVSLRKRRGRFLDMKRYECEGC